MNLRMVYNIVISSPIVPAKADPDKFFNLLQRTSVLASVLNIF